MIHFFPIFSDDPSKTPYGQELLKTGIDHRLFGRSMSFNYKSRLGLILIGWPRQILVSLRWAWLSLFKSRPHPDIVVLNSHFEVVIFSIAKLLLPHKNQPEIVYMSFIYTSRSNLFTRRLRQLYFRVVLGMTDRIICHSNNELKIYGEIFPKAKNKFRYVAYGLNVSGEENHQIRISTIKKTEPLYIFSAGRSGRDYSTLTKAVAGTGISTHIICDRSTPLEGINIPPEILILSKCYENDYLEELENAYIVVIPLMVDDISAGQMVLIQAMAYRKPIIITRTTTIRDYVQHERECLLVERNDTSGLQQAIRRLLNDRELATRLANCARQTYDERFCTHANIVNMIAAVQH